MKFHFCNLNLVILVDLRYLHFVILQIVLVILKQFFFFLCEVIFGFFKLFSQFFSEFFFDCYFLPVTFFCRSESSSPFLCFFYILFFYLVFYCGDLVDFRFAFTLYFFNPEFVLVFQFLVVRPEFLVLLFNLLQFLPVCLLQLFYRRLVTFLQRRTLSLPLLYFH